MRLPARYIAGNLLWARDGSVWAVWRVEPVSYPYLSATAKLNLHGRLRSLLMALPQEGLILSVSQRLDPSEVVEGMMAGVELDACPAWRDMCARVLDSLEAAPLYTRRYYLCVKLPGDGLRESLAGAARAAASSVMELVGAAPPRVGREEVARRRNAAAMLESRLRSFVGLRAVGAGEIRWLYARALRRGPDAPFLDSAWDAPAVERPGLLAVEEAVLKEGGDRSDPGRPRTHRRYLRVDTPPGTSFQTFLAVADMPHRFSFPGGASEWFLQADSQPFPIDWAVRIRSVPNQEAQLKARRQARQLAGQFEEYEGEPAGLPQSLAEAIEGVDDERAQLSGNPSEPEIQATVVFCVYGPDLAEVESQAAQLQAMFAPNEFSLPRPTGGQTGLFQAMLPGAPLPQVARDYTQFLLPRDLAAGMPFAGSEVGDPEGMLLGFTIDAGAFRPVLFDPAYGPRINRSPSLGAFGDLGAGKSYFIKQVAHATLARGGQVVTMDRTPVGEYVRFGDVAPGKVQIVRLSRGSGVCLDPLKVFAGEERVRYAIGFLTLLTGTSPTDLEGAILAEAVRAVSREPDPSLPRVVGYLESRAATGRDPEARILWRKLSNFAADELAQLAFGEGEVLTLDADYIVFHAPDLTLPDRATLLSEHLSRQLLPEQVFSQALLYLVAAVARAVTFRDTSRFAAALFDESWALTASMQGRALLLEAIRDGRKHNAAVWLLSQHPDDLGDDALAHLLGNRFVFRQPQGAGEAALGFLGMEPEDQWVELVEWGLRREGTEGARCLWLDVRGRLGQVEILPAPPELAPALETNPSLAR